MVGERRADWAARGIRASLVVDRAFGAFNAARAALVLGFASDETLDRYGGLTYGATGSYKPDSPDFDPNLFPFEEAAIARWFPPAPGRVLVGAAGGGREALVLATRGYEVVAFEPADPLIAALAGSIPAGLSVSPYRASYEDLPCLHPALPGGEAADLGALPRFGAAILGWGSLSHLLSEAKQVAALRAIAAVTDGPVLVSFRVDPRLNRDTRSRLVRLQKRLPGRNKIGGSHFTMQLGYFQSFSREQLVALFARAELRVDALDTSDASGFWGHAVVRAGVPEPEESAGA